MTAIVGAQLRRHRLQLRLVEQVQEKRGENIVAMMTQRDLRDPVARRPVVQRTTPQPRTEAAHGLAGRDHPRHRAVGVLLDDVERHAARGQIIRQHMLRVVRLLLVQVHRDQLEAHRRLRLQWQQDIQHGVRVLAARQAHHHLVAVLDHAEIANRLPHLMPQAPGQFVGLGGWYGVEFGLGGHVDESGGKYLHCSWPALALPVPQIRSCQRGHRPPSPSCPMAVKIADVRAGEAGNVATKSPGEDRTLPGPCFTLSLQRRCGITAPPQASLSA